MSEALLTQEVGSLAKPDWRVHLVQGEQLQEHEISDMYKWAKRLDIDIDDVTNVQFHVQRRAREIDGKLPGMFTGGVKRLAALYAVRLQEKVGLDIIYDGEQYRSEMYQHAISNSGGFEWRGRVRAFENKSFRKAASIESPSFTQPWHTSEINRLKANTQTQLKVPITGAYTLANWSYDERPDRSRALALEIAENVVRPNIQSLLDQGVEWIQIDEPAATTVPGEVPLFVESFNRSVAGLVGKFSVHVCFSDYSRLFPHVEKLEGCSQFSLEFANRDSYDLGRDAVSRPAYEILEELVRHNPEAGVGLGVTSVHDDNIEPAELVRDRVLRAVDILGDPTKVYPSPDCGLRTRSWDVAYDKLSVTVEGTKLAKQQLGVE